MRAMGNRCFGLLFSTVLLASFAQPIGVSAADKKASAPQPKRLVWPLPPDKPRIEYVTSIYSSANVEPPKKENLLDRVAGIRKRDFKPSFVKPYGVTTDSKGRLYVSDTGQSIVFCFDLANHKVTYIGQTEQVRLLSPMGLTTDAQDRLWVADSVGQHVYAFEADGSIAMQLGKGEELTNPTAVALDEKRHRAYVVDSKKHAILVYDVNTGNLLKQITGTGRDEDEHPDFLFPTNIAIDGDGRFYVTDTMRFRVVIFDPDYEVVGEFGSLGARVGQFMKPKGIALDSNRNIYVVDSTFNNFQVFDPKARLLLFVGQLGAAPGRFALPAGIHIDRANTIYVVDQSNGRVQIFKVLDASVEEDKPAASPVPAAKPAAAAAKQASGTPQ